MPRASSRKFFFEAAARASVVLGLLVATAAGTLAQSKGRITGTVVSQAKTPLAGVTVVAANQVTRREYRDKTDEKGQYSIKLPSGAYRVWVEAPYAARFLRVSNLPEKQYVTPDAPYEATFPEEKDYKARNFNDTQENVIVSEGLDTKLSVPAEIPKEEEQRAPNPNDRVEEPTGYAGDKTVESATQTQPDRREVRDRWRVGFPEYDRYGDRGARGRDIPFKRGRWYDPYNQSVLKGDYPIFGNKTFMILSAVSTSAFEQNRTPKPSDIGSVRPGSSEFFGKPELLAIGQTFQFTFEMFRGDSTFKPRTWAIKISPTFSLPNYARARENGVVNIDVRRGTRRTDTHFSFEEAFAEVKLTNTNENYDFVSLRAGIQPFVSDFRGFIYSDNNLGARLFGAFDNNRLQFNAAYFHQLEKDTNSGLNCFDQRPQNVFIANVFRQDFLAKGYTIQGSLHYNDDHRGVEYDRNGFLVRPALIGDVRPHSVKVGYLGIAGDGHIRRLNISHAYYFAFGRDDRNPIAGRSTRIKSHMAAVEASIDKDYLRFRGSFFFAQGDKNPTDARATGFDAIFDDPNFIGGQFSFWNRQGIRLTQTGVGLVQPNSILPSLRSSKTQGQANFVNPGIFIYNLGLDVEFTQRIKAIFNVNYLRFHRTEPLEYVLFQNRIRKDIGFDYSVGVAYRPFLINNVTFTFGAALMQTGRGFRDIFTDATRNCPPNVGDFCASDDVVIDPSKPLYALFGQVKFVF
ncbi:MAG TPA: carboxypeptidase-like regulatory domain-containing protein [Pyrinomonadaceae bacterium]|nr:carboxypeptidase-like regulatory domain-containing protein [Pyrinomonadaceae bacterium]